MQKGQWIVYAWPGLPHIWARGSWSALTVAVGAAAILVAAMTCSFGWTELLAPGIRNILWVSLAIAWNGAAIISVVKMRYQSAGLNINACDDPFGQAINLYVRADYYQAERVLNNLLKENIRDFDARLLLATLLRHTGRIDEAANQLDQLSRFEGSEKWEWEIYRERELLAEAKNTPKDDSRNGTTIALKMENSEIMKAA